MSDPAADAPSARHARVPGIRIAWAVALLGLAVLLVAVVWVFDRGDDFWIIRELLRAETPRRIDMVYFPATDTVEGWAADFAEPVPLRFPAPAFRDLVLEDPGCAVTVASLVFAPILFWAWRRGRLAAGRTLGVACAVAAALGVGLLGRAAPDAVLLVAWTPRAALWTATALFAAAFLVAPAPVRRADG